MFHTLCVNYYFKNSVYLFIPDVIRFEINYSKKFLMLRTYASAITSTNGKVICLKSVYEPANPPSNI